MFSEEPAPDGLIRKSPEACAEPTDMLFTVVIYRLAAVRPRKEGKSRESSDRQKVKFLSIKR